MANTVNVLKSALKSFVKKKESKQPLQKPRSKSKSAPKLKIKPVPKTKLKPNSKLKPEIKALKKVKKTIKTKKSKSRKKKTLQKQEIIPPETLSKQQAFLLLKRKESIEFITNLTGNDGLSVYKFLSQKPGETDEFTLADSVRLQINFVRSLLYKLYESKLVSFSRERDKKKGWFIYSWEAYPVKLKQTILQIKQTELEKLERQLNVQEAEFVCAGCSKVFDYATSMETIFFCSVCGGKLEAVNSFEMQGKLKHKMSIIKKDMAEIEKI